MKYLEVPT